MSANRRIDALRLLKKIKQLEVETIAASLGEIRGRQSSVQTELDELQNKLDHEAHITSPEAAPFLADFLAAIGKRRKILSEQMRDLDDQAAEIETRLLKVYSKEKANEAVLDLALEEKRQVEERKESAESAEIAQNIYLLRRARR